MITKATIEKDIPLPPLHHSAKFPFGIMEVGDSFLAVGVTAASLHQSMRRYRPRRYVARTVVEAGVRGMRVWRVE